jgi:hypothetical protein
MSEGDIKTLLDVAFHYIEVLMFKLSLLGLFNFINLTLIKINKVDLSTLL